MPVMDVFDSDAFSHVSLTKALRQVAYVPTMLTGMPNLFEPKPIRTKNVWVERVGDQASIITSTPRGAAPTEVGGDKRDARAFNTFRIALKSRISAEELLGIRRFGSEIDMKDLQSEIAERWAKLRRRWALTMEFHRFNVVTQGKTLDANNAVIYDWTAEFASAPSAARTLTTLTETAFNFAAGTLGSVRLNANAVVRGLKRNLETASNVVADTFITPETADIVALCGDSFYDQLVTHPEVRATFLNWDAAAQLRSSVGEVWQPFRYAGVEWVNYRGTDDNTGPAADTTGASSVTSMGIGTNHAKFFPRGAGIFQMAYAPGEKFEYLGSPGEEVYPLIVRDTQRDMWADLEMYSYPLPVCVLPQALASGRAGA